MDEPPCAPSTGPYETLIDLIAARLRFVAPTTKLSRELAKLAKPPRYVWVPQSVTFGPPGVIGANPQSLADRTIRSEVHCWGMNIGDAEWLEQALVTAVREVVRGRNYQVPGSQWVLPEWSQLGIVCTVTVDLVVPLARAQIPDGPCEPCGDLTAPMVPIERIKSDCC